jgi:hypothetical protein
MANHVQSAGSIQITIGGAASVEAQPRHVVRGTEGSALCVVFDTTGSMTRYIYGLVECTKAMVKSLERACIGWAALVLPFGDLRVPGDTIEADGRWNSEFAMVSRELSTMKRNAGGGNVGESSLDAMDLGLKRLNARAASLKVMLLITDEPACVDNFSPAQLTKALVADDVLCFVVAPARYAYYEEFADATGGEFMNIGSSVDLGSVVARMADMGRRMASRSCAVIEAGGSPQRLLSLEAGR